MTEAGLSVTQEPYRNKCLQAHDSTSWAVRNAVLATSVKGNRDRRRESHDSLDRGTHYVSNSTQQGYCTWMELSQHALNSAWLLTVAQLVLRSCNIVHLTYKQLCLPTDATAMCNCGIWVTGRNHSFGFAQSRQRAIGMYSLSVCLCWLYVNSPPPPHLMKCRGYKLLKTCPCSMSSGKYTFLFPLTCICIQRTLWQSAQSVKWQINICRHICHCKILHKTTARIYPQSLVISNCISLLTQQPHTLTGEGMLLYFASFMPRDSFLNHWSKSRQMQCSFAFVQSLKKKKTQATKW